MNRKELEETILSAIELYEEKSSNHVNSVNLLHAKSDTQIRSINLECEIHVGKDN